VTTPRISAPSAPGETEELSELAVKLPTVLSRLHRRLRQTYEPLGVPAAYYPVLMSLLDRISATVSELAAAEQVRVPSMTTLLVQMEADGLIQKEVDPSDHRFIRVSLNPRGALVAQAARRDRGAWFAQRLNHLSAPEISALERALPALEHLVGLGR
jgi:DNA-binding MarR family transcriptional regulator